MATVPHIPYRAALNVLYQKREREKGGWAKTAVINEGKNVTLNGCSHSLQ